MMVLMLPANIAQNPARTVEPGQKKIRKEKVPPLESQRK
jgi:hypothetical protein